MAYMNQPGSGNEFVFTNEWSHGLCGFCDDVKMCCCVFWCPCLSCCAIDKALGVRNWTDFIVFLKDSFYFSFKNFEYCKLIQCLLNVLCGVPPVFLTADFTASRALIRGAYKIQVNNFKRPFLIIVQKSGKIILNNKKSIDWHYRWNLTFL